MAELLYRLGAFSARRAWVLVTTWALLLLTTVTLMIAGNAKLSTAMSIDGIASQVVIDELKASFPAASHGSGQVVFRSTSGKAFSATQVKAISNALLKIEKMPDVAGNLNPFISQNQIDLQHSSLAGAHNQIATNLDSLEKAQTTLDKVHAQLDAATLKKRQDLINTALSALSQQSADLANGQKILAASNNFRLVSRDGKTALATIYFDKPLDEVEKANITAVADTLGKAKLPQVQVEFSKELVQSLDGILGTGEIVGIVIAGIVLLLMLGTFVGAGLPLLAALLGVGVSATITMALASVISMTSTTPTLGVMLGLAVGIDYSLFIINRHRRQLKSGMKLRDSIALANGTSGNAVLFAGLTVVIALVALNLTGIGFLGQMGTMGAVAIVASVAIALTFTPAMLSLIGEKVLSKRERKALANLPELHSPEELHSRDEADRKASKPVWATTQPWAALAVSIFVLITLALPAATIRLGLPDGSSEPVDSTAYKSYSLITTAFGEGANGQIATVVSVASKPTQPETLKLQAGVVTDIMTLHNVSAATPAAVSKDGKTFLFQVVPTRGPASAATEQLVKDLRALAPRIQEKYQAKLGVTGLTATNIDVSQKLNDALPLYLGTVILLSLLLLILVFRSIAVPLIASGGFLLTVFATLGSVVAVHQWGWFGFLFDIHHPGPILSFLPTMLIGILFGLAMDYQLFLVSGMREAYVHGKPAREAIVQGLRLGRSVVVAAAIIMITVFGGFAFSHLSSIRPIGFGLAIGVLLDAFLVRMLLVPALMALLGDKAWWLPKWLDRVMPDVDVEGAKLERSHIH
jgi:RND superfamily putative drug exporter